MEESKENSDVISTSAPEVNSAGLKKKNICFSSSDERKVPKWLALEELDRDRKRVSLNKDRVKTITQKLSKLQQGLEVDKSRNRTVFESRLKDLEVKLNKSQDESDNRFEETEQQIEQLMEALGQERLARELLDERKTKESEVIIKSIDLKLQSLQQKYDSDEKNNENVLHQIKEQLEVEKVLRKQTEEKFGIELYEQVNRLKEQVDEYKDTNQKLLDRLVELENNRKTVENKLEVEKQARGELEAHVVNMMEDLCSKMRTEIVNERNDRESMEETLLKLIEETCSRVEGGLISSE